MGAAIGSRFSRITVALVPLLVFAALTTLTAIVWRQQVQHQRRLLDRHTEDVCLQGARRIEVYMRSHLLVAAVFAKRWATHETQNFSQRRFNEFASVLVRQLSGYHGAQLVTADGQPSWAVPDHCAPMAAFLAGPGRIMFDPEQCEHSVRLSNPIELAGGKLSIFAVLTLRRGEVFLGWLVIHLRLQPLFEELFHHRIRSEFAFTVQDGRRTVYRHAPDADALSTVAGTRSQIAQFPVGNRTWTLTVLSRPGQTRQSSWRANLLIPGFGLLLSLCLSVLSSVLLRRMAALRAAHDQAVYEVAERQRAEQAQMMCETRYRSVFNSATDGLLVLDAQGHIEEANDAACQMHGYEPGGLDGVDVRQIIAPDHQRKLDMFLARLRENKTVELDSVDVRPDGSRLNVEVRGTRFTHQDKPALLAIVTDVTQRRQAMRQQAELAEKVLVAQEQERARVSRDLHDGLGQMLTALRLELEWIQKRPPKAIAQEQPNSPPADFSQAIALLETSVQELRGICKGLRPPILDDLGLEPALQQLVQDFQDRAGIAQIAVDIQLGETDLPLPPKVALCAYRIVQEALTNIQRHAEAYRVSVSVIETDGSLTVTVNDDGKGFDVVAEANRTGFGLAGMRERARLANGSVQIRSAPEQGTRIVLQIPLPRRTTEEET